MTDKAASDAQPQATQPTGADPTRTQVEVIEGDGSLVSRMLQSTPSWLVSMVVHMVILLVLGALAIEPPDREDGRHLVSEMPEVEDLDVNDMIEEEILEVIDVMNTMVSEMEIPEQVEVSMVDDLEAADVAVELVDIGLDRPPRDDLMAKASAAYGNPLSGRGEGKGRLVAKNGGSAGSQAAVALALKWLADHQLADGGWSFNHGTAGDCRGQCSHPGTLGSARFAATGLALMPFLGAGQTHKMGEKRYQKVVQGGLYYLSSHMKVDAKGGSMFEEGGRMYSHGIGSIALCEAYAMTKDKGLYGPAQASINFICYAQDPVGGGWRYTPRQAGDTSAVGWQIMALKSGHMAYLQVPSITVKKAFRYLDTVQAQNGAQYGYNAPATGRQATTAIGLLCRMYLGWDKENPALARGVKWISDQGPSGGNMYYNYYATQVMRHWEGDEWKKWNGVMRDQLVNSQSKKGHETGSWHFGKGGDHGAERGGRLYCTAMSTMVLEVYYRHLPIYRKQSTEEDFKLD